MTDYLLILPEKTPCFSTVSSYSSLIKEGIILVCYNTEKDGIVKQLRLIKKESFEDFVAEEGRKLSRRGEIRL